MPQSGYGCALMSPRPSLDSVWSFPTRFATAEIGPGLHNCSTSVEAVSSPIGPLNRIPNLMAQRLLEEVAWKARILSPGSESRPKSMRRDRAAALRIDPPGLAGPISIHLLQQSFFSRINIAMLLSPLSEREFGRTYSPIFGSDCRTFVSSHDNGIL